MTGDHVLFLCTDLREFVDRCSVDETLSFHPRPDPQSERWSIEAFQYVNRNNPFVFIHCEIKVCNATDPNSRCAQGCQPSRKRRDVETFPETSDDVYPLAQGPFSLSPEKRDSVSFDSDHSVHLKNKSKYFKEYQLFQIFAGLNSIPKTSSCPKEKILQKNLIAKR